MRRFVCMRSVLGVLSLLCCCALWPLKCAQAQATPQAIPQATAQANPPRWSQLAQTLFQHLGSEQGLPHPFVTALAEDGAGFIWMGTQSGLARWDGYRFRLYVPDPKDPGSLPAMYVETLHTDQRGQLWVGTNGGGLARYDSVQDRFVRMPTRHARIVALADDGAQGLWVGTWDGLDHLRAQGGAAGPGLHYVRAPDMAEQNQPAGHIRALLRDQTGRLWVGDAKGLWLRDAQTGRFTALPLSEPIGAAPGIFRLTQSSDGRIWVGTVGQGVFVLDATRLRAQAVQETGSSRPGLGEEPNSFIQEVAKGQIWIGTYGKGMVVVDSASLQTRRLRHDASIATSLADDSVWSVLRDRSGLIWVGSHRGVSLHDPNQSAVLSIFGGHTSITEGNVTTVLPMPDNSIWLGLQNRGINIVDPAANQIRAHQSPQHLGFVHAMTTPHHGSIYLGSSRGLFRSDLAGGQMQHLKFPPLDPAMGVNALQLDGNLLWVGAHGGLWRIDLRTDLRTDLRIDLSQAPAAGRIEAAQQLNKVSINVLQRGPDGALWIGTRHRGLFRLAPDASQLQAIPINPTGSTANTVVSLLFDRKARLWIATQGGIYLVADPNAKGKLHVKTIGLAEGLPNGFANSLLEDEQGDIWSSTDPGLVRIDGTSLAVQSLLRAEGVGIAWYWVNSGAKTAQGELLFGGISGLTVVRPKLFTPWRYAPPVVVTQAKVGGKDTYVNNRCVGNVPVCNELIVEPDANSVAVEFSALDYSSPERNRYAYWLEGYDKSWIASDPSRRLAAYTNLPPGSYRLRLRGSNRNGEWSHTERVLPIRVLPAWYQTWWWRLAELMLALAAIYVLVQARTRYLRRRQLELESQVQQRTIELRQKQSELLEANRELHVTNAALNQSNDALSQAHGQLVQQEKMASLGGLVAGIAHEINTPLGTTLVAISGAAHAWHVVQDANAAGRLSKSMLISSAEEGIEYTELALRSATRAAELVAVFKTIAIRPDRDSVSDLDLAQYLPELATLLKKPLEEIGCKLEIEVSAGLTVRIEAEALTEALTRILVNVIDHAFVDGRVGSVCLAAGVGENGEVLITVRDDGVGIAAEHLPKVFDPFFSTKSGAQGHVGLGLHVAYNQVTQRLKGQIAITSRLSQGTSVMIRLPK